MGLVLSIPSTAPNVYLFQEEAGGKGESVGEGKALAGLSPWGCGSVPTTLPSLPPQSALGPPWFGCLRLLGWASHWCCPTGRWVAAGAAMGG